MMNHRSKRLEVLTGEHLNRFEWVHYMSSECVLRGTLQRYFCQQV
jgi:hypothetical protein